MDRPFMHLNCAVDAHGRVAGPGGEPALLSTPADLARVHALRSKYDAILVGVETVLRDDPSLRVKPEFAGGPDPIAVVLDTHLRTPPTARVVRPETRIYHASQPKALDATLVSVPSRPDGLDLQAVLADLAQAGITSVLVEGGPTVLHSFVAAGLWDAFTVFQADVDLGDGPALWDGWERGGSPSAALGGTLWTFSP